jgi:hypothetical protein
MALDSLLSETATRLHRISDGGGTLSRWPSASLAVGISCPRSAPPRASSPPPAERRRRRRRSGPRDGRRPVGRARRGAAARRRPTPQPPAGYPRLRGFGQVCVGETRSTWRSIRGKHRRQAPSRRSHWVGVSTLLVSLTRSAGRARRPPGPPSRLSTGPLAGQAIICVSGPAPGPGPVSPHP